MGCAARLSPRSVCCRAGVGGGKRCFDAAPVCAEPNPQAEELTRSPGGARGCAHTDACASSPTPGPEAAAPTLSRCLSHNLAVHNPLRPLPQAGTDTHRPLPLSTPPRTQHRSRCRACHLQALPALPLSLPRRVFPAEASLPLLQSLETGV